MTDVGYSTLWWDPETGAEKYEGPFACNGICLTGADVGVPEYSGIAYPHPQCAVHGGHDTWPADEERTRNFAAAEATRDRLTSAYFHGLLDEQSPYPQHEGQMTHHEHD